MNAKQELLEMLKIHNKTTDNIVAIIVTYDPYFKNVRKIKSLEELDFDYYEGYGGQELYGYVLLDDQDWLERAEYDGAGWWEYKKYPSYLLEEELK